MLKLTLALPLLVACTSAEGPVLVCTTAPSPVDRMEGFVLDEAGGKPIAGAFVYGLDRDNALINAAITDNAGAYSMAGGSAVMRQATAEGYLDAYAYEPSLDLANLPLPIITERDANRLAGLLGHERSAERAMLLVMPVDCSGGRIENARIAVDGTDEVLYLGADTRFDASLDATSTDSAALVFDVPIGDVTVNLTVDGETFGQPIRTHANALTTLWIQPNAEAR